jgi:hypothetical protein
LLPTLALTVANADPHRPSITGYGISKLIPAKTTAEKIDKDKDLAKKQPGSKEHP